MEIAEAMEEARIMVFEKEEDQDMVEENEGFQRPACQVCGKVGHLALDC